MQIRWIWAVLVALLAGMTACQEVRTSDADVQTVSLGEVTGAAREAGTVLLDVRQPDDYAEGHLPGAINIPLAQLRPGDPGLVEADRIVVYADGWTDPLATAAVKKLLSMGYKDVVEFKGGVSDWKKQGYRLASEGGGAGG